ncbi:MAG TPA: rhamnan synthesis F family protein [Acetobacteraceae bacterium]
MRRIAPYFAVLRSLFRLGTNTLRVWPDGPLELANSVAIFVHFDRRGALAEHVINYVRALRDSGFSVVFVTNSGKRFRPDALATLQPLCSGIIVRRNVGYDFGAIHDALELLGLPRPETERLLIANDSVYGPFAALDRVIERTDFEVADLWGATESWQRRYHLQSYFLLAGRRALTSEAWRKFWNRVRQVSSKDWVVAHYEVGLTQRMLRAGLRCSAIWGYHDLLEQVAMPVETDEDAEPESSDPFRLMRVQAFRRLRSAAAHQVPLNPTADLWRQLLLAGFPFLKMELLLSNATDVPDIADWRGVLADLPGADVAVIERDLRRKLRHRAP